MSDFPSLSGGPRRGFPLGVLVLGLVLGGLLAGGVVGFVAVTSLQRRTDLPLEQVLRWLCQGAWRSRRRRRALPRPAPWTIVGCWDAAARPTTGLARCATARMATARDALASRCIRLRAICAPRPSRVGRTVRSTGWSRTGSRSSACRRFGEQYGDEALWAVVAYVRALGRGDAPTEMPPPSQPTSSSL